MTTPQLMSSHQYAPRYSYTSGSPQLQSRRDSLGGGCGIPVLSYTSLSSPRPANKRCFVDEDDDVFSSSRLSSPIKRSRSALKDTNMTIYRDDSSSAAGMKKTILGEKKSLANICTSAAKKSVKVAGDSKKARQIKLIDSKKAPSTKKRALGSTSPSPQRVARKSTTLSRFTTSSRSSEARHKALERARNTYSSSPLRTAISSSDESDSGVLLTVATAAPMTEIPESWVFDIYEDSHAETMQNLMEHSATVLDISDESEDEKWGIDEVSQKGKENISPERMTELMAGAGRDVMQVDSKEKKDLKEKRAALGDLKVETFYPKEEKEGTKKEEEKQKRSSTFAIDFEKIPSLDAPALGMGAGADFEVWASGGETDEETDEETGVPLTPPKGPEKKVKIVHEDELDECASDCGTSDKEN